MGTTLELEMTTTTCRICLHNQSHERDQSSMFPIFIDPNEDTSPICHKISMCTGIHITHHEKLPSLICKNCLTFLNIAYKFRSMCLNSQSFLQEYVCVWSSDNSPKAHTKVDNVKTSVENQRQQQQEKQNEENDRIVGEIETNSLDTQLNQEESRSSFLPADCYEECWLEGEESENTITEPEQKKITNPQPHVEVANIVENNEAKSSTANVPSKILGLSSDGGAVIVETDAALSKKDSKTSKKPYVCDICGNVYDRRYSLQAHIRRHRDEKPFECELCGQSFHCNFELSRHIRKHTGLRPYVCVYCKRSFGDRSTLIKHERIHRNERPYSCETCGKTFTYSSVLKVHQLTHTGEKPFNCELCGKRFSRSHHLRAHLDTLQHLNDPRSKTLLKQMKREEENMNINVENVP
ncbi:transcription factor Ouib isoform X1 [Stomoxys calcitrans]|uniref:transcription factor Ouib isoform X1 n=1 Tax=Stomoxys calcitrans TaxID=35570 RepID=UPI0027E3733D|nr:transcription factor Ouib isoform X1 [Stomoxys calcitrans]